MPRLSTRDYCQRHQFLRRLWSESTVIFASLSAEQQWAVHDFYQPSKQLTEAELLEHRRTITESRPSLPNVASTYYQRLRRIYDTASTPSGMNRQLLHQSVSKQSRGASHSYDTQRGRRTIRVHAVVKPELDAKLLARLLLDMAVEAVRAEQAAAQQPQPSQDDELTNAA